MEIKSQINTFTSGMDLDNDLSSVQNSAYRYAENIRLLTNNDGSSCVLNEMDTIRRYLINNNQQLDGVVLGVATGKAYNYEDRYTNVAYLLLQKNILGLPYNSILEVSNFDRQDLTIKTVCSGYWNITGDVQMVFNYETKNICKLYITDGNSSLKVINVGDGYDRELTEDAVGLHNACVLTPPELIEIVNGSLPVGQVQYCYQLFSKNGGQSNLSPLGQKIPTIPNAQKSTEVNGFSNDEDSVSSVGVSLQIKIYNASSSYNGIRIYRVEYISSTDTPIIYLINETQFSSENGNAIINFVDTGLTPINQYTVEEFNDNIYYDFIAQTICKKDNRLFAANLKESQWDVAFDARAYRCNRQGSVSLSSTSSNNNITFNLQDLVSGSVDIPEDHDCINPLNQQLLYPEFGTPNDYSYYEKDGNYYYGGAGLNVSYKFIQLNLIESENEASESGSSDVLKMSYDINTYSSAEPTVFGNNKNKLYGYDSEGNQYVENLGKRGVLNYSNAEIVSKYQTYQRDEIYRFGLVMYNSNNQPSPVHWIADIRFPSADCQIDDNTSFNPFTYAVNEDSVNDIQREWKSKPRNELQSRALGIVFRVNNLPEEVKAVEIVRCRRTEADRTVVTQGSLSKVFLWDNYTENENSRDTRPLIIPGFAKSENIACFGTDVQGGGSLPTFLSATITSTSKDIFDFTSADQCFNKDVQFINPGYYIVPLYVASSTIEDSDAKYSSTEYWTYGNNAGIQFKANERKNNVQYDLNYTGVIVSDGSVAFENSSRYFITDGRDSWVTQDLFGDWIIPCAVFKYFKQYDKTNATVAGYANDASNHRTAKLIDASKIATNIPNTEAVTSVEDITGKYIDQVGKYTYQNIAHGSYLTKQIGMPDVPMHVSSPLRWGLRGVTTILQSEAMINEGDDYQKYVGIDDNNHSLPVEMWDDRVLGLQSTLIVNIKKNTTSQYGGYTYFSRTNSIYNIHCAHSLKENTNQILCFGGDTYVGVLDHTHCSLWYPNDPSGSADRGNARGFYQALYPLESSVNVYARYDRHFLQTTSSDSEKKASNLYWQRGGYGDTYFMTEVGANDFGAQSQPMYTYNSAYSNTDGARNLVQKGVYDEDSNEWMNRIVTSDIKVNGEVIDSWMTFKFADYLDVDNQYGKITNLVNFNDRLFFFQDEALGIAQVNERSLITDNNASELVLGTGTILGRYDYVALKYGDSKIRDKSIVTSTSTMYWFDYDKNILCAYNNQIIELSKVKNVQTHLNGLSKSDKSEVVSLYDNKYNEVWFTIKDKSLIFNEQVNAFSGFYTHSPQFVLTFSDYTATIKNSSIYYIHNIYNLNNSNVEDKTCKLELIINQNYQQTKVYDNVFFDADFTDLKQVKSITFKTKTQQTDQIDYSVIDNREDTYRFFIPREHLDNKEQQENESMSYAARMRGKYLICDYTFDCNGEKQIEIPFIKTTYRDSLV